MLIYESINKLEIEKSGGMEYTYIKSEKAWLSNIIFLKEHCDFKK